MAKLLKYLATGGWHPAADVDPVIVLLVASQGRRASSEEDPKEGSKEDE